MALIPPKVQLVFALYSLVDLEPPPSFVIFYFIDLYSLSFFASP